ncbi:MAG: YbhB/YbcL family Raf kinase inhibitor-like protein [Vicinamibacterales bacterium]
MRSIQFGLVALVLSAASMAAAQPPPAQPAQPGGGQNRRAPIQVMTLTTTGWPDGGTIPIKHSQAGKDVSPALAWSNAPAEAVSFVIVAHDLDTLANNGDDMLHWLLWNIPKTVTAIPEGAPALGQLPDGTRQLSGTGPYYRGPAAPASGPPHHYVFEIYALDAMLDVVATGQNPGLTRAAVMTAMTGHIRGKGVMVGLYKK